MTIHRKTERRYRCTVCRKTFRDRSGTVFAGLRKPEALVETVITLLAHGCPRQASVAADGLDDRTVAAWTRRAGDQCARVHEAIVLNGSQHIAHIQADEIRAKCRPTVIWLAIALPSHLWVGGVSAVRRDSRLAQRLFTLVRRANRWVGGVSEGNRPCLSAAQPLGNAGSAAFGRLARPEITPMITHTAAKRVVAIERRIVRGGVVAVNALLALTVGGTVINTAFIERFKGTLRPRLAVLTPQVSAHGCPTGHARHGHVSGRDVLEFLLAASLTPIAQFCS